MLYDYVVMHFEFKQESNYKNHVFKEGIINVNNINFIMYVCACSMIVYLPFLREIAKDLGQSVNNCNTIVIAFRVIRTVLPYYLPWYHTTVVVCILIQQCMHIMHSSWILLVTC